MTPAPEVLALCKQLVPFYASTSIFTLANVLDGLDKDWTGNVWMNPPYSHPEVENFTSKLIEQYNENKIDEAIVLVNNATDTIWFHEMLEHCKAICLTKGRIGFIDQSGEQQLQARQGQVFLYFGEDYNVFQKEFSQHGKVLSV